MRPTLTSAALAALLAGVAAVPAAAQLPPPPPPDGTTLDVTAEGRTTRVPDVATIRAGVLSQTPTAVAALSDNATRMARVLAALRKAGVAPRDIRTANVSLNPQYRFAENQPPALIGYQATNAVAVRFRDIAKAGAILDALVAEGANQIEGPSLSIDQPDAALDEARTEAVRIARARAELYAKVAGLSVARVISISESGSSSGDQPSPMYAMRTRGESRAPTQIASGETEVSVTLSVRFALK